MSAVIEFLLAHGPLLAMGASVLLLLAFAAAILTRSPAHRQRLAEAGVFAAVCWIALAAIPMPRWRLSPEADEPPARFEPARQTPGQVAPSDLRFEHGPIDSSPPLLALAPRPGEAGERPRHAREVEAAVAADLPTAGGASGAGGVTPASMEWPATAAAPGLDWPRIAAGAYLCGAGGCIAWLAAGHVLLWRMLRRAAPAPAWVAAIVCQSLPSGARAPRVWIVRRLARPASVGAICPVILLPWSIIGDASPVRARQIVLHELAHILRRDGVGNALFNFALPLMWFHPLYWLLRKDVSLAREMVADDWAARFDGKERYVAELVELASIRLGGRAPDINRLPAAGPAGAIGIFGRKSDFFRRMRMLLQNDHRLAVKCSQGWRAAVAAAVVAAVTLGAGLAGVQPARAQNKPPPPTPAAKPAPPAAPSGLGAPAAPAAPAAGLAAGEAAGHEDPFTTAAPSAQAPVAFNDENDNDNDNDNARDDDTDSRELAISRAQIKALEKQRDALAKQVEKLENELARSEEDARSKQELNEIYDRRAQALTSRSVIEAKIAQAQARVAQAGTAKAGHDATSPLDARWPKGKVGPRAGADNAPPQALAGATDDLSTASAGHPLPPAGQPYSAPAKRHPDATPLTPAPRTPTNYRGLQSPVPHVDSNAGAAANRNPLAAPAAPAGVGMGGVQLDLVNLANSVADAGSAVRIAEAQLQNAARDPSAVNTAKAALEGARRRLDLLRGIARLALQGAAADLNRYQQLSQRGAVSQEELSERMARVQMLELIVGSAEDSGLRGDLKPAKSVERLRR